ncbi:unnamed protein product [Nyctereutes procyonoides]|uniref:(raccoon dog) hypothetical protein n=1 Tax=Nyctereutes procyonoides TaxID=34880 RepID=A0A811Z721_NYCPR|nr:unnamed protein product [Nyctereutes procyonoides]
MRYIHTQQNILQPWGKRRQRRLGQRPQAGPAGIPRVGRPIQPSVCPTPVIPRLLVWHSHWPPLSWEDVPGGPHRGIASGKSSVIHVFQELSCAVTDVDVIARHVVQPGYPAHRHIVEAFGTEVLLENGDINRKVLGNLIFNQPDRRHLLNTIIHPEIRKEMMKETFKYFLRGYRYVILDIPLLFETKKYTQLVRLMRRNSLTRKDAEDKVCTGRQVLDNSGEWSTTKRQVLLLHAVLERSLDYLPLQLGVLTGLVGIASFLYTCLPATSCLPPSWPLPMWEAPGLNLRG